MSSAEAQRTERIAVDSHPASLYHARRFVERVAAAAGIDSERTFDLKVAVSEACANAVEHAQAKSDPLSVCAHFYPDRLVVQVSGAGDFRVSRNPMSRRRTSRSLGLPLMVALMDEVCFTRRPDGGTSVTLSVFLQPGGAA